MSEPRSKCCGYEVHWERIGFTPGKMSSQSSCGLCLKPCKVIVVEEKIDRTCPECGKNLGKF